MSADTTTDPASGAVEVVAAAAAGGDEALDHRARGTARPRRWWTRCRPPRGRTGRSSARRLTSTAAASPAAARARRPRTTTRTGCRGAPTTSSSSSTPSSAGGVRSWSISVPGHDSAGATPASAARNARSSPSTGAPSPQIGARCCWRSRTTPFSLTSRSRWIASCATRRSGRSTFTRRRRTVAERDPPREPEVAVEPGVHAARRRRRRRRAGASRAHRCRDAA